MPFRFQGRYLFLTYSQCNVSADTIIALIRAQREPVFILVGNERHADGGEHRHVFVDFGRRFSFSNERRFDVSGHHPNIARPRRPQDCLAYCSKDGNTTTYGEAPNFESDSKESRTELWGRLLDESTSASDFLSRVRVADPFTFAVRYQALASMAAAVYPRREAYEAPSTSTSSTPRPTTLSSTTSSSSTSRNTRLGWGVAGSSNARTNTEQKKTVKWEGKCCIILCNTGLGWDWRYSEEWKDDPEWFEGNVPVVELDRPLYNV
ncbi:replication-associated protein [Capybara virus 1_cap1_34]|nr:replication-associated protein [Capybara virus 1_cap1_34]